MLLLPFLILPMVFSSFQPSTSLFKGDKCRVLSLRAGGTKGAYEVGVLTEMLNWVDPKEMEYDVVEGVSAGSVNSALISIFNKGDEKAAFENLKNVWLRNPVNTLWKNWPVFSMLASFWKPSLYDNTKMMSMI